ncbi:signal peptidase I [Deinococcus sp. MIMF12]|uniref:Signal peptidase I n=1 Tax=Deinococcus rhizophilus TaxID=3049544 RepID=A0ABT7JIR5_9DEIO|nr:signal peptidase I [Deinococcus rhizophilus]MDL2344831.1 signal peptidase I [Deinococcus rhizophilus]
MPRVTPPDSPLRASGGWREVWRIWILGALLPVWLATTFGATLARVDGDSMEPTLRSRDLLLLLKYPRWLRAWGLPTAYPQRGDLLIFKAPADSPYSYGTRLGLRYRPYNVKRVIALPGETVEIRDSQVVVNGRVLAESYVNDGVLSDQPTLRVPPGKVWVLGDNRLVGESLDSRAYGPVDLRDVAGPANLRLWPRPELVGGPEAGGSGP